MAEWSAVSAPETVPNRLRTRIIGKYDTHAVSGKRTEK